MTVNLSMFAGVGQQFFDDNGVVLVGGLIYTYAAGTTTPQATYTTSAGVTPHTNPIVLDAAGRVPSGGEVWLSDAVAYKFVLKDSASVTVATYDNVTGNASGVSSAISTAVAGIYSTLAASSGSSLIGYLQGAGTAVATTVQAKLRQIISVKDFGAKGDGATDDTLFIQNAIDAANGAKVYFPAGTYKITASLKVPNNAYLYGDYFGSTITTSSSIPLIVNDNSASFIQVTLQDLSLNKGTYGVYLSVSVETAYNNFINVSFSEQTNTNFYVNKLLQVSNFTNCNFLDGQKGVVSDGWTANANTFTACKFGRHSAEDIIFAGQSVNNRFTACDFESSVGNSGSCLTVDNCFDLVFDNCWFENGHNTLLTQTNISPAGNPGNSVQFNNCSIIYDNAAPNVAYQVDSIFPIIFSNCYFEKNVTKTSQTKIVYQGVSQPQVNTSYYAEYTNGFHKLASLPNTYPLSGSKDILAISSSNVYSGQLLGTLTIQYQSIESGGLTPRWLYAQYRIVVGCLGGSSTLDVKDIALIDSNSYVPSGPAISVAVTKNVSSSTSTKLVFQATFTGITAPTGDSLFTWTFESSGGARIRAGNTSWYLTPSIVD